MMLNILLTSVGRRTYLVNYFKEALSGSGSIHAANSVYNYSMSAADKSVVTPLIYDDKYIEFLLQYCLENNINVVISLFDIDLPVLAKNKALFNKHGINAIVPDEPFARICNDKWLTHCFFSENGMNTPQTYLTLEDCVEAVEDKKIAFPLIVKPRWGMGSIGVFEADNMRELEIFYTKTHKQVFETYLRFESSTDPKKSVIIQEKIQGEEFGLNLFNDLQGNFLTCIALKKFALRAGETDLAETVSNTKLINTGNALARLTKHPGNLDVDCFVLNGTVSFLEMNCRFGGQYPFFHLAGTNFPKALVNMLLGKPVSADLLSAKPGVRGFKNIVPVILQH